MASAWATVTDVPVKVSKSSFVPSVYQQAIFDFTLATLGTGKHLVVQAVAGSGKSKTGVEMFNFLPGNLDSVFVAFNKHIADELKAKLPQGAKAMTYHSLGLATLRNTYRNIQVDSDKVEHYLKEKLFNSRWMIPSTKKLVSLCKGAQGLDYSDSDLAYIAFDHDVDLYEKNNPDTKYLIFRAVRNALQYSIENPSIVDFDDMVWLPSVLDNVSFFQYDYLFVDEVQDTNGVQLHLAINSVTDKGNICGVGDVRQSIYRFRGADSSAMTKLQRALDAEQLPLSISYRCPVTVREWVNKEFPDIAFESAPWAIDGKIENIVDYQLADKVQEGDMVLCRVNADLVTTAFSLIRKGIKATIKGRDIGKGLVDLMKKSKADDLIGMLRFVQEWRQAEVTKAVALDHMGKIPLINDKVDTIIALAEDAKTVSEVVDRCVTLFSDERSGVTLSSIHRAKGLEADNVFILRPDLIPHPAAKKAEDKAQESNLKYVAGTRTKNTLTWVM